MKHSLATTNCRFLSELIICLKNELNERATSYIICVVHQHSLWKLCWWTAFENYASNTGDVFTMCIFLISENYFLMESNQEQEGPFLLQLIKCPKIYSNKGKILAHPHACLRWRWVSPNYQTLSPGQFGLTTCCLALPPHQISSCSNQPTRHSRITHP